MNNRIVLQVVVLGGCVLSATASVAAATFVVNTTVDSVDASPGDGIAADSKGLCSLRAAVLEANMLPGSDTIIVPTGTYVLSLTGDGDWQGYSGDLNVIFSPLAIEGAGAGKTVIDGGASFAHFSVSAPLTLRGLTLANGTSNSAGAVYASGPLVMEDCEVTGCQAPIAVYMAGGSGTLSMARCNIHDNLSTGIFFGYNQTTIEDTTISGNDAPVLGGGLRIIGSTSTGMPALVLRRCTISGNTAGWNGGGVEVGGHAAPTFINCTISGNSSPNTGGINRNGFDGLGPTTLESCTVTGNQGSSYGGCFDQFLVARNTIIAGNIGTPIPDTYFLESQGHNLIGVTEFSIITGDTVTNIVGVDPELAPLTDNGGFTMTHAISATSPAVDAGDPAEFPDTDQRSVPRPGDGDADGIQAPDIGAFEINEFIDCNDNRQPDDAEIAANPLLDSDASGILDSCEAIGDLDGNGVVNGADLGELLGYWGACPPPTAPCAPDLNDDGVVDGDDLGTLLGNWG